MNNIEAPEVSPEFAASRKPTWRLSTLLLLASLVIAVVANLATVRQLQRVESELRMLRSEVGYLEILDPAVIAAVRVPTTDPLLWQFRVHVPPAGKYRFSYGTQWKAEAAHPHWISAIAIPPGRSVVTIRVMEDPRDSVWKLVASMRQGQTTVRQATPLTDQQQRRFRQSADTFQLGLGMETKAVNPGESLTLVDQRWLDPESGLMMFGSQAPRSDIYGIFGNLEPDLRALNR